MSKSSSGLPDEVPVVQETPSGKQEEHRPKHTTVKIVTRYALPVFGGLVVVALSSSLLLRYPVEIGTAVGGGAAVVAAFFAFKLTGIARTQADVTNRQLAIMEHEFLAAHPPILTVRIEVPNYRGTLIDAQWDTQATFGYRVINTGGSDAVLKAIYVTHDYQWTADPFLPWKPHGYEATDRLVPGGQYVSSYTTSGHVPAKRSAGGVIMREGPDQLVFFGRIAYENANGRPRECSFCRTFGLTSPIPWRVTDAIYEYNE